MASSDRTDVNTYDNVSTPDPIRVQSRCNYVLFQENDGANTTRYKIYEPSLNAKPVTKKIGDPYEFQRDAMWSPGQIIGYCEVLDVSSADFAQEEKVR